MRFPRSDGKKRKQGGPARDGRAGPQQEQSRACASQSPLPGSSVPVKRNESRLRSGREMLCDRLSNQT